MECGEPNYFKDCPLRRKCLNNVHTIQEATTVGDISRSIPRISATLENMQADYQTSMVEIEGMLNDKPISILIYPSASLSYISPRIVQLYRLQQDKFEKSLLVQLAIGTKYKVTSFVKKCYFIMNGFKTHVDLNILPLRSYELLIRMDWLEKHRFI